MSTGYLANSSRLLSKIATLLGKDEDAEKYHSLWQSTRAAWRAAFIRSDGCIGKNRQDDYVRALAFELLEPDEISGAVTRLVERIVAREYHLETGFLSTPLLLPILAQHGHADIAYKLLLQTSNPSWLAQIDRGATTVWETWEGYDPTGKAKMSHNHYAFGAVVSWLYEGIAGLSAVEPGYRRIRIAPCIGGGLTSAAASVKTPFGLARSAWRIERGEVHLEVMVPPGSEAFVCLGDGRIEQVGSGDHQFVWSHSS
ncbi:Bacterial alpha-L-rhamnosidase [compost metagenome]